MLHIRHAGWGIFNLDAEDIAVAVPKKLEKLQGKLESIMKGTYDHFMQKEIFEQPDSIHATMLGRVKRVCHIHLFLIHVHQLNVHCTLVDVCISDS